RELGEIPASAFRRSFKRVVLFGLCELSPLAEAALAKWEQGGGAITALIFADGLEGFDPWGRIVKAPSRRAPHIPPSFVERPGDYASKLEELRQGGAPISCAMFDPAEARYLAALERRSGKEVSNTLGRTVAEHEFTVFLRSIETATRSRRLFDLLTLL